MYWLSGLKEQPFRVAEADLLVGVKGQQLLGSTKIQPRRQRKVTGCILAEHPVGAEHQAVLKFLNKSQPVGGVTQQGGLPAVGGQIAVQVWILPHKLRNAPLDKGAKGTGIARFGVGNVGFRHLEPERLGVSDKNQLGEFFQCPFQAGQPGVVHNGVNQSFYQLLRVECLEGNLPSTENELAISQTLAKKTGWKIGDQVSLDLLRVWTPQGVDSAGEMIYRQTSGPGIMGLSDSYMLRSVGEKQFTITAIVDPGGFDDQNVFAWEPCFTVLEDQIPPDGLWCAYYTVSSLGRELYDLLESIQEWQADLPVDAGGVGTIDLNRQLLLYYGIDYPGSLLLPAFYGLMAVTLLIILVDAVSLARNAFAISMTERTQMLGMLASVGATRAQKRQSVLYEAFILGLIGIPLGLIAGCGGMAITLVFLNSQVQELFQFSQPLYLSVRPLPLAAAALLAALTLAFSALQPALKAGRITPMDAIQGEGQVQFHSNDVKTGKLTGKIFGFPGILALKNCKRNRGRYRAIVFSLALSVIMLLAGTGLSYYVDRAMGVRYGTDSPLATATITFNDPSLDTATYTDDLKALAGTGEVRLVGGLQAGEMGSFTLNWADMSQDAIKWFQNQSGLLDEQDYTSEDGQNVTVYCQTVWRRYRHK